MRQGFTGDRPLYPVDTPCLIREYIYTPDFSFWDEYKVENKDKNNFLSDINQSLCDVMEAMFKSRFESSVNAFGVPINEEDERYIKRQWIKLGAKTKDPILWSERASLEHENDPFGKSTRKCQIPLNFILDVYPEYAVLQIRAYPLEVLKVNEAKVDLDAIKEPNFTELIKRIRSSEEDNLADLCEMLKTLSVNVNNTSSDNTSADYNGSVPCALRKYSDEMHALIDSFCKDYVDLDEIVSPPSMKRNNFPIRLYSNFSGVVLRSGSDEKFEQSRKSNDETVNKVIQTGILPSDFEAEYLGSEGDASRKTGSNFRSRKLHESLRKIQTEASYFKSIIGVTPSSGSRLNPRRMDRLFREKKLNDTSSVSKQGIENAGKAVLCGMKGGLAVFGAGFSYTGDDLPLEITAPNVRFFLLYNGPSRHELARLIDDLTYCGVNRLSIEPSQGRLREVEQDLEILKVKIDRDTLKRDFSIGKLEGLREELSELSFKVPLGVEYRSSKAAENWESIKSRLIDIRVVKTPGWLSYKELLYREYRDVAHRYIRMGELLYLLEEKISRAEEQLNLAAQRKISSTVRILTVLGLGIAGAALLFQIRGYYPKFGFSVKFSEYDYIFTGSLISYFSLSFLFFCWEGIKSWVSKVLGRKK